MLGQRFKITYKGQEIELRFYSETKNAVRAQLGNSSHNIWIPKSCIGMRDNKIVGLNVGWMMLKYDFRHKIDLINGSKSC